MQYFRHYYEFILSRHQLIRAQAPLYTSPYGLLKRVENAIYFVYMLYQYTI